MKKLIYLVVIIIGVIVISCNGNKDNDKVKDVSSGNELLSEDANIGEKALYPDTAENKSEVLERSFENAPPLIPHTVKGMYTITTKKNECTLCHLKTKEGKEKEGKPVPESHFTDYRPKIEKEGDLYAVQAEENEVVAVSTGNELNKAMYNCNLCHAPQANITVEIDNFFEPDFRDSESKNKSNLNEKIKEGIN